MTVVVLVVDENATGDSREALGTLRTRLCLRKTDRCSGRSAGRRPWRPRPEREGVWNASAGGSAGGGAGCSSWRTALVLVAFVALGGLALFNSTVYHVGTTEEGTVALYHGMPNTFLGWRMYSLVEVGSTPVRFAGAAPQGSGRRARTRKQGGGAAVRPQPRRAALSTRNKELLLLFPAILLTTIGFATVYIRHSEALEWVSLSYGAIFLGLFGLVHVARRLLVPRADPYLLPITALLSTLGILMIYRLKPDLALAAVRMAHRGAGHVRAGAGGGAALQAPGPVQVHRRA